MKLFIRGEFAARWLYVRELDFRFQRLVFRVVFIDSWVAGDWVTTRHGDRWPRLLPKWR